MLTITLLSDLGTADASVAIAKAVILRHLPDARIADVSHHVAQYDLQQAAYLLLSSYRHFPKGTVHIIMVDILAGDKPRALLAVHDGHLFIAPDNGLLPLAFGPDITDTRLCFEPGRTGGLKEWINGAAKVIQAIQTGGGPEHYAPCDMRKAPRILQPKTMPGGVECSILYIDRYGNVVLDITRKQFEDLIGNKPFRIKILRMDITQISENYNDVKAGEPLCRFNDAGFLEIAINREKAAALLGLDAYNAPNLRYQVIKLFFDARQ
jgi:S-adenosyl-L-methionine hydrolase (adenosine-forming)